MIDMSKLQRPPQPNTNQDAPAVPTRLFAWLLLLCSAGVYFNSLYGELLFDDWNFFRAVPNRPTFWPPQESWLISRRAFVELSWNINHALFGNSIAAYHAVNIAIHSGAALALFFLARLLLQSRQLAAEIRNYATQLAFFIALIWCVHPLNTQAVTYITQRYESLAGLMILLTLLFASKAASVHDANEHGTRQAWPWFAAAIFVGILAVFSKEIAASVGLLALLADRTFIAGTFGRALRKRWWFYLALLLLPALYSCTDSGVVKQLFSEAGDFASNAGFKSTNFTPIQYLFVQGGVILHYLRLSIWPHPLCFDYFDWLPAKSLLSDAPYAAIVGLLALATLWALWKRPAIGFLGAVFFIILAPSSSIIPIRDVAVEYRMYLSLIAVIALLVVPGWLMLVRRTRGPDSKRGAAVIGIAFATLVTLVFGALTIARNNDYSDALELLGKAAELRPGNPRNYRNMAAVLVTRTERPHYREEALACYARATELVPDDIEGHIYYARIATDLGQLQTALDRYTFALTRKPGDAVLLWRRGGLHLQMGNAAAAETDLQQSIQANPKIAEAHKLLAVTHLVAQRRSDAIAEYRKAIELEPQNATYVLGLAFALSSDPQNKADANTLFERATKLSPDDASTWATWGLALVEQGALADGRARLEKALELQPNNPEYQRRVAWALAIDAQTSGAAAGRAVQLAEAANRSTGSVSPMMLDTLAAAYARSGRFDVASTTARSALENAQKLQMAPLVPKIAERISLYDAKQAYSFKP